MSRTTESAVRRPTVKESAVEFAKKTLPPFGTAALAFLLSAFGMLGVPSPFGLAFAAAQTAPLLSLAAVIGSAAGYLLSDAPAFWLSAAAIAVLRAIMRRKKLDCSALFLSLAVFVFLAASQLTALVGSVFDGTDVLIIMTVSVAAGGFAFISARAMGADGENAPMRRIAVMLTVSAAAASLAPLGFSGISAGWLAISFLILAAVWRGRLAGGAVYGVAAGLFLSAATESLVPLAAFSVGGMLAGILSGMNRTASALGIAFGAGILSLFGGNPIGATVTAVAAGAVYILLPAKAVDAIGKRLLLFPEKADAGISGFVSERLGRAGKALRDAAGVIENASPYRMAASAAKAAEEKFCSGCKSRFTCYGRLYDDTVSALQAASYEKISGIDGTRKKERLAARCRKASEIFAFIADASPDKRPQEAPAYRAAAELFTEAAADLPSVLCDGRLEALLRSHGEKYPEASAVNEHGLEKIVLSGKTAAFPSKKIIENEVSEIKGRKYRLSSFEENEGYRAVLIPEPRYGTLFSGGAEGKDGNTVCGDSMIHFETPDGRYFAAISDGMGSGEAARSDSLMTVNLLKSLLSGSFDGKTAMKAVNSALSSKNSDASFATVDILAVNLHSGKAEFIKSGAAPSFVKRGSAVFEITSSTLPAGLTSGGEYDKASFVLKNGDTVIMMSDGVYEAFSDIRGEIAAMNGLSPSEICRRLLSARSSDDKSAVAVRICSA